VIFDPLFSEVVTRLPAARYIYDCLDLYSQQPQFAAPRQRAALEAAELSLSKRVDSIWASSTHVAEHFQPWGLEAHFAPGAVTRPAWAPLERRDHAARGTATVHAIYVGALDPYKVDMGVFWALVDCDSRVKLTIIGGFQRTDGVAVRRYEDLAAHDRVSWIGPLPREDLGPWLYEADFGVVAMTARSYSRGSFPLKYWDYQWAGLPVLAANSVALVGWPGVLACDEQNAVDSEIIDRLLRMRDACADYVDNAARNDARARVRSILDG
jgi:hypothetical protein